MMIAEKPKIEMHTAEEWKKINKEKEKIYSQKVKMYPQELREKIKEYKGIYSKELLEYLEALTTLEVDILKDNTYSKEQIEKLKQIELYRKIVNYNAHTISKKILSKIDEIAIDGDCLRGELRATHLLSTLFDIRFMTEPYLNFDNNIGIAFFKNEDEPEKRKKEIEKLYKRFDEEDKKENPYDPRECRQPRRRKIGGPRIPVTFPHDDWEREHTSRLESYDLALKHLESMDGLTEQQIKENELSDMIYKRFEQEYGPFENNEINRRQHENTGIQLVKKNNNVNFIKKIRYYYE